MPSERQGMIKVANSFNHLKTETAINLSLESHNAPVPYPTKHHFVTELCTHVHISVTQRCIVGYATSALWDLCSKSIIQDNDFSAMANVDAWCHADALVPYTSWSSATFFVNGCLSFTRRDSNRPAPCQLWENHKISFFLFYEINSVRQGWSNESQTN